MIDQVRPSQLAAWLEAASGYGVPVVLDVREAVELQMASVTPSGNPAGFELVAMPMGTVPARLAELDPDRPIACLCHHGIRSHRVAAFLAAQGFARVANIAGGIDAWSRELDASVASY